MTKKTLSILAGLAVAASAAAQQYFTPLFTTNSSGTNWVLFPTIPASALPAGVSTNGSTGLPIRVVAVTNSYAASNDSAQLAGVSILYAVSTNGASVLTLPYASNIVSGAFLAVKDLTGNPVAIKPLPGDWIDGSTNAVTNSYSMKADVFVSDRGTNWYRWGKYVTPAELLAQPFVPTNVPAMNAGLEYDLAGHTYIRLDTNLLASIGAGATNAWGTFTYLGGAVWTNYLTAGFIITNSSGVPLMETNSPNSVMYSLPGGSIYAPTGTWTQVSGILPVATTFPGYDRYAPGEALIGPSTYVQQYLGASVGQSLTAPRLGDPIIVGGNTNFTLESDNTGLLVFDDNLTYFYLTHIGDLYSSIHGTVAPWAIDNRGETNSGPVSFTNPANVLGGNGTLVTNTQAGSLNPAGAIAVETIVQNTTGMSNNGVFYYVGPFGSGHTNYSTGDPNSDTGWNTNGQLRGVNVLVQITNAATAAAQAVVAPFHFHNYYVGTNGSDANNGTATNAPWLTISNAIAKVMAPATINILDGTSSNDYNDPLPLTLPDYVSLVGHKGQNMLEMTNSSGVMPAGVIVPGSYGRIDGIGIQVAEPTAGAWVPIAAFGRYAVSGGTVSNDIINFEICNNIIIAARGIHFEDGLATNVIGNIHDNYITGYYEGIGIKDEGCSNFVVNCYNNVVTITNVTGNTGTVLKGSYGFNLYNNPYAPASHITLWNNTVIPEDSSGFAAYAFFNGQTANTIATNICVLSGTIVERPANLCAGSADVTNQTTGCIVGYENLHRSDGMPLIEKNGPAAHRSMFALTPNSPFTTFNSPGMMLYSNNWTYAGPQYSNYLSLLPDNQHWINSSNGVLVDMFITNGVFNVIPLGQSGGGIFP